MKDGKKVKIRFEIDITKAGMKKFPTWTEVATLLDEVCNLRSIATVCGTTMDVGKRLGDYTITKYISVK